MYYLKDCFKRVLPCGPVAAYLTTYVASVMLHGLNFQLGAVLLSLGFFAKVEHDVRSRLADMFSASIGTARNDACRHKEWEIPVAAFNMVCGMLVVFNLAYLGVMFNQDTSMASVSNCQILVCLPVNDTRISLGGWLFLATYDE